MKKTSFNISDNFLNYSHNAGGLWGPTMAQLEQKLVFLLMFIIYLFIYTFILEKEEKGYYK